MPTTHEIFSSACESLRTPQETRSIVAMRYQAITQRLNEEFWGHDSPTKNSLYVGSYGRDTAAVDYSDIDVIMSLPWSVYSRYSAYANNGQSALLQAVKGAILGRYRSTDVRGDGQVVQVRFSDGINFEVVPAFEFDNGSFYYPNANDGGSWHRTDPRAEIKAIRAAAPWCGWNLKNLCRLSRAWKARWGVRIGGLLIDTLAYRFLSAWQHRDKGYTYYDWMLRDFFVYLSERDTTQRYWLAIGSSQHVHRTGAFEDGARQAACEANEAIRLDQRGHTYLAKSKWEEILGLTL